MGSFTDFRRRCPSVRTLVLLAGLVPGAALLDGRAAAQSFATARDAVDSLAAMRDRAEPLWRAGEAEGTLILEAAWDFLREPGVEDLWRGSPTLQTRVFNLAFETACAHAIRGDTAQALRFLKEIHDTGGAHGFAGAIERACPELHALRELPAYRRVLDLWRSERLRWGGETFATSYRERLDVEERVAGLSLVWAEVRNGLPSFEVAPGLDLDSLYLAYLPAVRAAGTTFDYYRTLERFVAELRDAHTNVSFPPELRDRRYSRPPLRTLPIEGRALVRWILSPRIEHMGIEVGQEIVAIDGLTTEEYVAERVAPYVAASTPQDLELRSYGYQLLAGDAAEPVHLTLERADGSRFEVSVPRSGYDDVRPYAVTTDSVLDGGVGYLRIDGFGSDTLRAWLPEALSRLDDTRALVIDVRRNGGGSTSYGDLLLSMLAAREVPVRSSRVRAIISLVRARGLQPLTLPVGISTIEPHAELRYDEPVVVLTSPMTFSAAEDFAVAFDAMERGTIIGQPTGGSTGQPFGFPLPGGGSARVRTKHDSYADGREFIAAGVQPDVVVAPSVAGIRAGRDEVLEAALEFLRR